MNNIKKSIFKTKIEDDIVYYEKTLSFVGESSIEAGCLLTPIRTVYTTSPNFPSIGTVFYDTIDPLVLLQGNNLYWSSNTGEVYLISSLGVITAIESCGGGGQTYGYTRDGSQEEGNPNFHKPIVNYLDGFGNPQVFYPSMTDDICGYFVATEIVSVLYAIPC